MPLPGTLQYYSCTTIAIGSELLVYYGDDYFVEMGYELNNRNSKKSKYRTCKNMANFHRSICGSFYTVILSNETTRIGVNKFTLSSAL